MKIKPFILCVPAVMLSCSLFGDIVQAPWPVSGGAEQNLYQLLGFADLLTQQLNSAIINQTDPLHPATSSRNRFHCFNCHCCDILFAVLIEEAGNADVNSFGIYDLANTANQASEYFQGRPAPI